MEIKRVPISEVEVWDKNPRNIKTEDFERLKRQIKELGVYKPLICFKENGRYTTLGGNMRLMALKDLKMNEVDISIVRPKTEAEKIKYSLSDNDRMGQYMEQELAELTYPYIEEINLEDYRIDIGEPISLKDVIENYAPDIDGEDEIPEIDDSPAITKMGDLFMLGKHRLLCGDAMKEEDIKRLMNGEKADMVFTDPPYGIDLDTDWTGMTDSNKLKQRIGKGVKGHKYSPIIGDEKSFDFKKFGNIECEEQFWFGADYYHHDLPMGGSWFIWDKRLNERMDKVLGSAFETIWSKKSHKKEIIRKVWAGAYGFHEDTKTRIHPTQKPIGVCQWFVNKFSKELDVILDIFLGSGTTLIASEKLNRICMGMEIEPKYVDVCITRYANFTSIPEEEIRATRV